VQVSVGYEELMGNYYKQRAERERNLEALEHGVFNNLSFGAVRFLPPFYSDSIRRARHIEQPPFDEIIGN
jgi:hypothetical protein